MGSPAAEAPLIKKFLDLYRGRWHMVVILGASYLLLMWLSEQYLPYPGTLFPAVALSVGLLFLEGIELWPVIYIATLIGAILGNFPPLFLVVSPIAYTLEAVAGAYLLQKGRVDPLFRHSRDIFLLLGIVVVVSAIAPTIATIAITMSNSLTGTTFLISPWTLRYTGNVFCLLLIVPLVLRWLAKPRFRRTSIEGIETLAAFALLIAFNAIIFIAGSPTLLGIPVVYLLLIPLFWIALRLRPRFVTLSLFITTLFALFNLYFPVPLTSEAFTKHLFQVEGFMIVIAVMFYIIVSLEEDRRLSSNLLKSQVAMLENAVARISSESGAKNDFIAVLAHELRNPLAPIVSAIDFLKLKEDRSHEELETLKMMEGRMHIVRRLLDDLLDISRISEGKLTLKMEPLELETIIRRSVITTNHLISERHQLLTIKMPKKSVMIQGDPVRIEQIFSNLLANASKYSEPGERISLIMTASEREAEVVIRDVGIGIDDSLLETIFTPFQQGDVGTYGKKGLGIGLALVKSFVTMHGGTVTAASKGVGQGSIFTVRLPLYLEDVFSRTELSTSMEQTQNKPARMGMGPHILVVDDNDAAASGMGRLLELKGCTVAYAYDGRQAVEQMKDFSPDIIILDIGLPDQDGYHVAKVMRTQGYTGKLIALTGYSTDDAKERGKAAGFDHYLIKPAGLADLISVIPEIA